MTVTLDLNADEAQALEEMARTAGTTMEVVLHALVAQASPSRRAEAERAQDPADTAEAAAERRREQEEVEANIQRWHQERAPA